MSKAESEEQAFLPHNQRPPPFNYLYAVPAVCATAVLVIVVAVNVFGSSSKCSTQTQIILPSDVPVNPPSITLK